MDQDSARTACGQGDTETASGQVMELTGRISSWDDEEDHEDHEGSVAESLASTVSGMKLPVIFLPGCKVPSCFLCRVRADAPSPLIDACPHDTYGCLHPWPSYKKVRDDQGQVIGKTPRGKLCLISRSTYHAIGYDVKYGKKKSYQEYKEL